MTSELTAARNASRRLNAWLAEAAYPIWSTVGIDGATGRFREKIAQDGRAVILPTRGRVSPRQIYAFSAAPRLGWRGDAEGIVRKGLAGYLAHHRRADGLIRQFEDSDVEPADLYDQAFALFGLAAAHPLVDGGLVGEAEALRRALQTTLGRAGGGFETSWPPTARLESNPHMHLLEAGMAWAELTGGEIWISMAQQVVDLARTRFIAPESGALREFFDHDWRPVAGIEGRIVEPGHQFEWAWLLMRWSRRTGDAALLRTALRLLEIGESYGIDAVRGVAFDSLLDDLTPHATTVRLWPQTERIKAAALAAQVTGEPGFWAMAARAVEGLERHFDTPVPGLWRERMRADGGVIEEPAPASSFYHIVLAADVLKAAVDS